MTAVLMPVCNFGQRLSAVQPHSKFFMTSPHDHIHLARCVMTSAVRIALERDFAQ